MLVVESAPEDTSELAALRKQLAEFMSAWQAFPGRSTSEEEWYKWISRMPPLKK